MATQQPEPSSTSSSSSSSEANLLELNETVSRISAHKGVEAVQILNKAGDIIAESGGNNQQSQQQPEAAAAATTTTATARLTKKLLHAATTYLRSLDADDEVAFLQMRSKGGRELMIAPHQGFALVVLKRY